MHRWESSVKVKARAHVWVSGRVQDVFFRQATKREANSLGVKGWVRNLPDGKVEAVFEGEEDVVKMLLEFVKQGPPRAKVSKLDVTWEEPTGEFRTFSVVY
ncbi:MAG: acylphosphatase [Candidatus Bathyarchaeia archaeon]